MGGRRLSAGDDRPAGSEREEVGMDAPYPGKLRLWAGWVPAASEGIAAPDIRRLLAGPHHPAEFTDRLYACEALNPPTGRPAADEGAEPYTLQWFLNIESQRHSRQGRWIPRLLEFAKHPGETLLGLGTGLGTDWIQYARHGASVVVCSPSAEQLALVRRNFELRGLSGRFLHAAAASLPLESASIDVICASSLFEESGDAGAVVDELYRVLKPGGKVLVVAPARYDVDFWASWCSPWPGWLRRVEPAPADRLRFSRRGLHRLFGRFTEHRIHKRQLRRSEVPPLWRWAPLPMLERLLGHVLVLKAFKPLSAAMAMQVAA
jgi:ubiquinone/menaquinone biosynthesis C-methylase UbiE